MLLDLAAPLEARDLNPATESLVRKLGHLPWELLHDGQGFLAERGIQPIRLMRSRSTDAQPANRPLRLLFMATSPEDVQPVLDYEREEATILEATRQQPIDLVVEESGSVSQLKNLVDSFDDDHFDRLSHHRPRHHRRGHAAVLDRRRAGRCTVDYRGAACRRPRRPAGRGCCSFPAATRRRRRTAA